MPQIIHNAYGINAEQELIRGKYAERINIVTYGGIGDTQWVCSKLANHPDFKRMIFWMPGNEHRRGGQYLEMIGADYGYLNTIHMQPDGMDWGMPPIPESGVVVVQANRWLESGYHLRKWYPDLEWKYPKLNIEVRDGINQDFVIIFMGWRTYHGGGNIQFMKAENWIALGKRLKDRYGMVRFIGARKDVEWTQPIAEACGAEHNLFDRDFAEVMAAALNPHCKGAVGVNGGPLITMAVEGVPVFMAYPDWLHCMIGTWEPLGCTSCFHRHLPAMSAEVIYSWFEMQSDSPSLVHTAPVGSPIHSMALNRVVRIGEI